MSADTELEREIGRLAGLCRRELAERWAKAFRWYHQRTIATRLAHICHTAVKYVHHFGDRTIDRIAFGSIHRIHTGRFSIGYSLADIGYHAGDDEITAVLTFNSTYFRPPIHFRRLRTSWSVYDFND